MGRGLIFAILLGLLMTGLDASIVNVMLPKLQDVFQTSLDKAALLGTVYLVMTASLGLLFGRLSDLFSSVKLFSLGVLFFGLGSGFCALSQTLWHMLLGRAIQGLGGAILAASFGAVILHHIPKDKTGSVVGQAMMVSSVGALVGPPLGGWFAENLSWHWAFAINIPLCVLAFFLLLPYWKKKDSEDRTFRLAQLDLPGAFYFALIMIALPSALHSLVAEHLSSPKVWLPFLISVFSVLAFVWRERKTSEPLLPAELFFRWDVARLTLVKLAVFMALNGVMLIYPFFVSTRQGFQLDEVGLLMLASAVAMTISTPLVGKLSDRIGSERVMLGGAALLFLATLMSYEIQMEPSKTSLVLSLASFGASLGVVIVSSTVLFLKMAAPEHAGVFSAVNSLMAPIGGAMGFSLFSLLYGRSEAGAVGYQGFQDSLHGVLVCSVLLLGLSFWQLFASPDEPSTLESRADGAGSASAESQPRI